MYQVMAMFNGTNPSSSSLNGSDPYGNPYAVCTTSQYDLRPSTNSSTLAVLLQSTDAITAAKTPGELRDDMKGKGLLNVWTGPGDSWCTWFKIHVRIHVDWLNLTVQAWMGFPWGAGIEQCTGLENIFTNAYNGLVDNDIPIAESAVINGITTVAAAFVTGGLATMAASITAWPAYPILLGVYVGAMALTIIGVHYGVEKGLARSILLGMGGALIGFVLGLYCLDFVSRWWTSASLAFAGGSTMQVAAAKATVNYFGSSAIKQVACVCGSWINVEFNVATAALGLMALGFAALGG
jgi:hypothetical protein